MKRGLQGDHLRIALQPEPFDAFLPRPLPPDPPPRFDAALDDLRDRAHLALGRLDSISTLLPDPSFLLYLYIRKEAVLSSQIEGTQSSLSDLLPYELRIVAEITGRKRDRVFAYDRYVAILNEGTTPA